MQTTVSVGRPATPAQISFIEKLANQVGKPVPDHVDLTRWTTAEASEMIDRLKAQAPSRTDAPATERQVEYIRGLLDEREVDPDLAETAPDDLTTLTAESASELIRALKVQPRKPAPESNSFPGVPDGHYALTAREGHTMFLRVYTFRNGNRGVSVQASDEYHAMPRTVVAGYLTRIEQDLEGSLARYGHEIGRCGICNRTLTDAESRVRGIGPVCYSKI